MNPNDVHLAICTPAYDGRVFTNYHRSMIDLAVLAEKAKLKITYLVRSGESLITRGRNSMVAEFLSTPEFSHLMWIDADIGFNPRDVFKLLSHDLDVVAGLYPLKHLCWPEGGLAQGMTQAEYTDHHAHFPFNPLPGAPLATNGLIQVLDAPTGFMLIKRSVLETMKRKLDHLQYRPDYMFGLEGIAQRIADNHFLFFDTMVCPVTKRYLSEDYAFARRWQGLGGSVYADLSVKLEHAGSHTYTGDPLQCLVTQGMITMTPPPPAPEVQAEPTGWADTVIEAPLIELDGASQAESVRARLDALTIDPAAEIAKFYSDESPSEFLGALVKPNNGKSSVGVTK
jgi:hypothetical protein